MKVRKLSTISLALFLVAGLAACKKTTSPDANTGATRSNANTASATVTSNTSPVVGANQNTSTNAAPTTPKLVGIYEISEVRKEGVVTMISELRSTLTFKPDGTYRRESSKGGKVYHFDAGKFQIEGTDKLVLTIETSKKGKHNPPILRAHQFSLSPDGSELRMDSDDGKVAIYRRVI
jgi:hypothetical protein